MATIADRMNEAMTKYDISINELSRRTGINVGTLSHYKNGSYEPKQTNIYLISQALGVSPEWLMAFDDPDIRLLSEEARVIFNSLPHDRQIEALEFLRSLKTEDTEAIEEIRSDSDK